MTDSPHIVFTDFLKSLAPGQQSDILNWQNTWTKTLDTNTSDIAQGIDIAIELSKLSLDTPIIAAALAYPKCQSIIIHPTLSQSDDPLQKTIIQLLTRCRELSKIDQINTNENSIHSTKQQKQLRHVILAMANDVRCIPILLAKQLIACRYAKNESDAHKKSLATHTHILYNPLANRLGFGTLKWQLEDICLRYLKPDLYKQMSDAIAIRRSERDNIIQSFTETLKLELIKNNIQNIEISGRAKHLASMLNKMQRKNVPIEQLYDSLALRVLLPNERDCYRTLAILHQKWSYIKEEFDDYIAHPKKNGYQSIHSVILYDDKHPIEIQIRSYAMHENAERGACAHWAYKEGQHKPSVHNDQNRINTIRQMIGWKQSLSDTAEAEESTPDFVYIFTPQGNVIELPYGATALDFAYHIHTQVGHRCKGAKINNHLMPLTQILRNGDHVDVLTHKEDKPSRDWLRPEMGYLKTTSAKNKVTQWFRQNENKSLMEKGQKLWEKISHEHKKTTKKLSDILTHYHLQNAHAFYIALARGDISIKHVKDHLTPTDTKSKTDDMLDVIKKTAKPAQKRDQIHVERIDNLLYQFARCCQPLPGDEISGFITQGRGITIHRPTCDNYKHLQTSHPERMISVTWKNLKSMGLFICDIRCVSMHRDNITRDINNFLVSEKITCAEIHTSTKHHKRPVTIIHLKVHLENLKALNQLMNQLRNLPGITSVERA